MSNASNASGGLGLFSILGIIFITLKLCKVIDWSWWWVTAPFWGPLALLLTIMLAFAAAWAIAKVVTYIVDAYKP